MLVLASTSPYRRQLLERLGIPFTTCAPQVDEAVLPNETPAQLVLRLSEAKARAGAALMGLQGKMLIIGSDQVADFGGAAVGKPNSFERARAQLQQLSGKTVIFRTGLALFNPAARRCCCTRVDVTTTYRKLSDEEIDAYLEKARPLNCAGAARSEDLGIALFERIESDDPTALIGLPLIALTRLLRAEDVNPLLWWRDA
ncbi:MAG: Maf family nucleotide pyrophosphatase [Burkholderiales bacterium]|jgi:MAF protein|nr:Maf family nucleotide pyrophosphatase [Burkholderiales bacterium]